jgi:hypothetical protein
MNFIVESCFQNLFCFPFLPTCLFTNSLYKKLYIIHRQPNIDFHFQNKSTDKSSNSLCDDSQLHRKWRWQLLSSPHDSIEDAVYAAFAIDFIIIYSMFRKNKKFHENFINFYFLLKIKLSLCNDACKCSIGWHHDYLQFENKYFFFL